MMVSFRAMSIPRAPSVRPTEFNAAASLTCRCSSAIRCRQVGRALKALESCPLSEATTLMKIPVLPISYADAQPFLSNLEGPVAPEAWRGALPVTYHIGPGPATARLKVELDSETRPIYNVLATIPGSEFARRVGDLWQSS